MNLNGVEYWYIRNAQGDIIGLHDKDGVQVVSYVYDSWGKLVSITGTMKDSVGVKNPYRYRGYRYDTETGLYYLQSRYYNAEWSRFINADGILGSQGKVLSYNMFAYCMNNPINMVDQDGRFAIFGVVIAASLIIKTVLAVATVLTTIHAYYTVIKPLVSSISSNISNPLTSTKVQSKSQTKTKKKKEKKATREKVGRAPTGPEEMEPTNNHKSTNEHKIPTEGQAPNSSLDQVNENGETIMRRFFDDLGRALRDIDFTDHGYSKAHPIVPHVHSWDWVK